MVEHPSNTTLTSNFILFTLQSRTAQSVLSNNSWDHALSTAKYLSPFHGVGITFKTLPNCLDTRSFSAQYSKKAFTFLANWSILSSHNLQLLSAYSLYAFSTPASFSERHYTILPTQAYRPINDKTNQCTSLCPSSCSVPVRLYMRNEWRCHTVIFFLNNPGHWKVESMKFIRPVRKSAEHSSVLQPVDKTISS